VLQSDKLNIVLVTFSQIYIFKYIRGRIFFIPPDISMLFSEAFLEKSLLQKYNEHMDFFINIFTNIYKYIQIYIPMKKSIFSLYIFTNIYIYIYIYIYILLCKEKINKITKNKIFTYKFNVFEEHTV